MKALSLKVYRNRLFAGCSNGGISEKYEEVLLACEEGYIEIDALNPPENLVVLIKRNIAGSEYMHLEPYASTHDGYLGWMAGGAYAGSSDGRFCRLSQYPLSIHDRQETPEQYDLLSR